MSPLKLSIRSLLFAGLSGGHAERQPLRPRKWSNWLSPSKSNGNDRSGRVVNRRWTTFAALCGLESLVLPLTVVAASINDDSLVLSIPLNLLIITALVLVACWPYRNQSAIALCTIHLITIVIATFGVAVDIESLVLSGPLLLITGIALPLVGTGPRMTRILCAVSTVAFVLTLLAISDAGKAALFTATVVYQMLFAPVGLWLLYYEFSKRKLSMRRQLSLKHVLATTVIVCVACALAKVAYSTADDDLLIAIAVAFYRHTKTR